MRLCRGPSSHAAWPGTGSGFRATNITAQRTGEEKGVLPMVLHGLRLRSMGSVNDGSRLPGH